MNELPIAFSDITTDLESRQCVDASKTGKPPRDHLILDSGGTTEPMAVRQGAWKLITPSPKSKGAPKLFNLGDDLGATKDLAAAMPDKVKELTALLAKCRSEKQTRLR